jgi:thioredoxin 1
MPRIVNVLSGTVLRIKGNDFEEEVLHANLPVVVDFYGGGCPPCEIVSPIVEELAKEYDGKVKFVKLNMDDDEEQSNRLAARFELMSVPTLLFFREGKLADRVVGVIPKADFRQRMESLTK